MRKYPQPSDYQGAIQNPQHVFSDTELRTCKVRKNPLGLPAVSAGGFALSFYLDAPGGQHYVVRCFKADSPDRRLRYDAISRFLNDNPRPFLLDVDYLDRGILVNGEWYPVVKMPYVKGVTFQRYIEEEIGARRSVAHLPDKFRRLAEELEKLGIAHGDLQHGNIMVQGGELVLVDYDGMYVPALKGKPGAESGQPSYQHPDRDDQFFPELDRFSMLVIHLALSALAVNPDLWARYSNGDNLLFRQADFTNPGSSKLLRELETIPALKSRIADFRNVCKGPLESVPRLADFWAGATGPVQPAAVHWLPPTPKKRQVIYDARRREELLRHLGEQITVVGQITDAKEGRSQYGSPYVFLNFGDYRTSPLSLVLWSDVLNLFRQQQKPTAGYVGQWVQVTGMLTAYTPGRRGVQPQIVIDVPTQIEVIKGGEREAFQLLAAGAPAQPPLPPASTGPSPSPANAAPSAALPQRPAADFYQQLNKLYPAPAAGAAASPPPSSTSPAAPRPPAASSQSTLAAHGIYLLPVAMSFGSIPAGQSVTRQLQIVNRGNLPAVVTVQGQPHFLMVKQPMVSCAAGGSVHVDVQLNTAAIPPGLLQPRPAIAGAMQEWTLSGASLLLRCGNAEQNVAVEAVVAQKVSLSAPLPAPLPAAQAPPAAPVSPAPAPQPVPRPPGVLERRLARIVWAVAAAIFLIAIFVTYPELSAGVMQWASTNSASANSAAPLATGAAGATALPSPTAIQPAAGPAGAKASAAGTEAGAATPAPEGDIAALCPTDLAVTLVKPKDFLMVDEATFVWNAAGELAAPCRFQVKLWRQGRPRIVLPSENVALAAGGNYELVVSLAEALPRNERSEGIFSWTVEVTLDALPSQALATAAEPLTFYWMPPAE